MGSPGHGQEFERVTAQNRAKGPGRAEKLFIGISPFSYTLAEWGRPTKVMDKIFLGTLSGASGEAGLSNVLEAAKGLSARVGDVLWTTI